MHGVGMSEDGLCVNSFLVFLRSLPALKVCDFLEVAILSLFPSVK